MLANRLATRDTTLPDGTFLSKGTSIAISATGNWDASLFPEPQTFDPYRFLRLRNTPGQEHKAHLVSTSPEVLGFSHGKHACPGRFFAANEVKIALVHLLLRYDWSLVEGKVPKVYESGAMLVSDPVAEIGIRRRRAEIDV